MRNEICFDLVGSPENVIPAVGACPALDTGAGIYKCLKILDSPIKSGNDKQRKSIFNEFDNLKSWIIKKGARLMAQDVGACFYNIVILFSLCL